MGWRFPEANVKAAPGGTIRMQFSRFLALTSTRQGVCVSTGNDACLSTGAAGSAAALAVEYDPVDRVVVLKPQRPLAAGQYKVRVLAPKSDTDETGIRAFDGVPLAQETSFELTVDASVTSVEGCPWGAPLPTCEPRRTVDYCTPVEKACMLGTCTVPQSVGESVASYMGGYCALSTCHVPSLPKRGPIGEAFLLNDGPDAGGVAGAIARIVHERVVAPESATDPDPAAPRQAGQGTLVGNMPYIDPGNPGNSFVLYKMIIGMLHCPAGENDAVLPESMHCAPGADGGYQGSLTVQPNAAFYKCSDITTALGEAGVEPDAGTCPKLDPTTLPLPLHAEGDFIPYLVEPWVPDSKWASPIAGEYARLRYRIRGNPMPSSDGLEGPQNMHMISAWIAKGAPTAPCQ